MAILTYFLIVLINCQVMYEDYHIQEKEDCKHVHYKTDVIVGQIKYLTIIQFFNTKYKDDLEYYKLFFSRQVELKSELQTSLKSFDKILVRYNDLNLQFYIEKIEDNINPHDSRVEQAFKLLLEICNKLFNSLEKFQSVFQSGVDFLKNKIKQIDLMNLKQLPVSDILHQYQKGSEESKIRYFIEVYNICQYLKFQPIDLIQLNQNSQAEEQVEPLSTSRLENSLNTLQISDFEEGYNLQDFETEIQVQDCNQKLPIIQSLLLEFQKLSYLIEFKSSFKIEAFQQFLDQQDQLIIDSIPIKEYIKGVKIDDQIELRLEKLEKLDELLRNDEVNKIFQAELNYFQKYKKKEETRNLILLKQVKLDRVFHERLEIYQQLMDYKELMEESIKFFSFDKQQYKQLQQTFESLISYIKDFKYSKDYITKGIKYFQRDILICESKVKTQGQRGQSNAISKDNINQPEAKIYKQEDSSSAKIQNQVEQQKVKIQNQAEDCSQKLLNIEQKIYQYSQAIEMNGFIQYSQHYDKTFKEIENIQSNIFSIIQNLDNYQELFQIQEKLYFVQVYPTHKDPEDIVSVQAYDNLLKLQNLIGN